MTSKVRCLSRLAIEQKFQSDPNLLDTHNIVSLLDTGLASPFMFSIYSKTRVSSPSERLTGAHPNLLTLHVDDVTVANIEVHAKKWGGEPHHYQRFTIYQAATIVEWFEQSDKSLPYIAHCWLGKSRSGAVGRWISEKLGFSNEEFRADNPHVDENPMIYRFLQHADYLHKMKLQRRLEDYVMLEEAPGQRRTRWACIYRMRLESYWRRWTSKA